jgi:hypothetical protein
MGTFNAITLRTVYRATEFEEKEMMRKQKPLGSKNITSFFKDPNSI